MTSDSDGTSARLLVIGCTSFAGPDSVAWESEAIPNIPDYDIVVVSVPHMTEQFLKSANHEYFAKLRKSLVRFLHSGGKLVALVSAEISAQRPKKFPETLSNTDWCPVRYRTVDEAGLSIIREKMEYISYLNKMSNWSYYLNIAKSSLSRELIDFYGALHDTKYSVSLIPYLKNRYDRVLAGEFFIDVRNERRCSNQWETWDEYPKSPDHFLGPVVLLPLLNKVSPEEAIAEILLEEIGYSLSSPEPDWALRIEMPHVAELTRQAETARNRIAEETTRVGQITDQIADIQSYRRLLFGTGNELESIVKRSLEDLGAVVAPTKYGQEEYILEYNGKVFLIEVKGVSKSISVTHLRQLNDYLLKFEEDTGKQCKGILFGNAWRTVDPELRGTKAMPEFPDNVVRRAEQWGISLVSSKGYFERFVKALNSPELSTEILTAITDSSGLAFPSEEVLSSDSVET